MMTKLRRYVATKPRIRASYKLSKNIALKLKRKALFHKPQKVAVIGWLGAFNLGDEMMLDVTLLRMKKRGNEVTLLTHDDSEKVMKRYRGYKIIPRRPLTQEAIDSIAQSNDVLFVNGGAMIDDRQYADPNSLAHDISRLALTFVGLNKKVIVYGVSTNTRIKNPRLIEDYSQIISNAAHFSVRDEFSKRELSKFAPGDRIQVVDDIVFADKNILTRETSKLKGRRIIAVIMVYDGNTMEDINHFFIRLLHITEASVKLILFYDEKMNDVIRTEDLKQKLGELRSRIDEMSSPVNSADLYNSLADVDLVISMRYHGVLFANAIGKKVICLEYDKHPHYHNKNKYLREHYDFNHPILRLSEIKNMTDEEIWKLVEHAPNNRRVNVRKIYRRANSDLEKVIRKM